MRKRRREGERGKESWRVRRGGRRWGKERRMGRGGEDKEKRKGT